MLKNVFHRIEYSVNTIWLHRIILIYISGCRWYAIKVALCKFLMNLVKRNTMRCITIHKQYTGQSKIYQIHSFTLEV